MFESLSWRLVFIFQLSFYLIRVPPQSSSLSDTSLSSSVSWIIRTLRLRLQEFLWSELLSSLGFFLASWASPVCLVRGVGSRKPWGKETSRSTRLLPPCAPLSFPSPTLKDATQASKGRSHLGWPRRGHAARFRTPALKPKQRRNSAWTEDHVRGLI